MSGEATTLRLHGAWNFIEQADRVELWHAATARRLVLRGPAGLPELVARLHGGVPADRAVPVLAQQTAIDEAAVAKALDTLAGYGAVITAPPRPAITAQRATFDPQLEYFSLFERSDTTPEDYQRRLANATVLVAGLGGLGSWIALLLSRIGVGSLVAIDSDVVEPSNLSRQILYNSTDARAGRYKVDAAAVPLAAANPELIYRGIRQHVRSSDDVAAHLPGVDIVVLPFGYLREHRFRDLAAAACVAAGVPFLTCGAWAVGPLCRPGHTPCHVCAVDDPRLDTGATPWARRHFIGEYRYAPWIAARAARTVDEVARFLAGHAATPTTAQVITLNHLTEQTTWTPVRRKPHCPMCGEDRAGTGS